MHGLHGRNNDTEANDDESFANKEPLGAFHECNRHHMPRRTSWLLELVPVRVLITRNPIP